MKIGILTFHYAINYGAVYQALGLQQELRRQGHEPEFINFIPSYMRPRKSILRGWGLRSGCGLFRGFENKCMRKEKKKKFEAYRKTALAESPVLETKDTLIKYLNGFDAVIVGSDQVWDTNRFERFDGTYFGDFMDNMETKPRLIAYAPCFGTSSQNAAHLQEIKSLVRQFDSVAVRNNFSSEIILGLGLDKPQRVVDPAFFYSPKIDLKDNNVCIYYVDNKVQERAVDCARICSKLNGEPVVHIKGESPIKVKKCDFQYIERGCPSEWFDTMASASFIVTESFHGVVFSISKNKPFVVLENGKRSDRVLDLLRQYQLEEHFLGCEDNFEERIPALLKKRPAPRLLQQDIEISRKFLTTALLG